MEMLIVGLVVFNVVALVGMKLMKKKGAVTTEGISVEASQAMISRSKGEKFALLARFLKGRKEAGTIERNLTTAGLMLKPTEFLAMNLGFLIVCVLAMIAYQSLNGPMMARFSRS
jgi:hypothetical protein